MKNLFRFLMAVAVLFTVSCAKEDVSSSLAGGEVEVTFTANLADLGTRAIGDGTTVDRVYLAIFENNTTNKNYLNELTPADGYPVSNGKASMTVVLLKNKVYDLVFWAQKDGTGAYDISRIGEREIKVNYNSAANAEDRDAFFLVRNAYTAGAAESETEFILKRPFAQINVGNTDADVEWARKNGAVIKQSAMSVTTEIFNTLDLSSPEANLTGDKVAATFELSSIEELGTISGTVDPTAEVDDTNKEYNYLAMNYLLVDEKTLVELNFSFVDDDNITYSRSYHQVPVQRNYRTNILGSILASEYEFEVTIDPIFNKSEYEVDENNLVTAKVYTVEDFVAAFAENSGIDVVVLENDINLVETASRAAVTPTVTIKAGKTLTLDLNGYTLSGVESATGSFGLINNKGNLTINDSKGDGAIKLTATENRGWNAYSSVISNQPGGVLVVNGGTIEHLGGTDMAYGIDILTNGKGTSSVATINGGHIKSTYRAVRQFLNGIEANNSLTVNGGVIEGANKSIWMQDPSAKANTGSLVVKADANLVGDVYLFVTAGSTEWPVSVYIAKSALQGESTVISGNVPTGYYVVETEKCFAVATGAGVLVTNAEELAAALAEGATEVTLAGTFDSIVAKSGVSYWGTAYATVGHVVLYGAENVTLKNISFDAANAVMSYDGSGKTKLYANIMNDDNGGKNTPSKGASNIVIDGCTFTGKFANGGASIAFADQSRSGGFSGNITIKNCTFNTEGGYYDIYGHYCGNSLNGKGDFIIENNTFKTKFSQGLPVYLGRYASNVPVVVKGNAFETVSSLDNAVYVQDHSSYGVSVNAENNTFAQ